jgi:hypothetical protein
MMKNSIIGLTILQEAIVTSHSYLGMLEHYTVPQLPCDAWLQEDGETHILKKYCPSIFKRTLPQQEVWNKRFPSMVPRITRPNATGLFPLGLCEEYRLSGENCRWSNSATLHYRGNCNSDRSHAYEHVERDRMSFKRVSSNFHTFIGHSALKWILQKQSVRICTGFNRLGIGSVGGL